MIFVLKKIVILQHKNKTKKTKIWKRKSIQL